MVNINWHRFFLPFKVGYKNDSIVYALYLLVLASFRDDNDSISTLPNYFSSDTYFLLFPPAISPFRNVEGNTGLVVVVEHRVFAVFHCCSLNITSCHSLRHYNLTIHCFRVRTTGNGCPSYYVNIRPLWQFESVCWCYCYYYYHNHSMHTRQRH